MMTNNNIFDAFKIALLIYFVILLLFTIFNKKISNKDSTPVRER